MKAAREASLVADGGRGAGGASRDGLQAGGGDDELNREGGALETVCTWRGLRDWEEEDGGAGVEGKTQMECQLTQLELDAVEQLIQLSRGSAETGGASSSRTVEQGREESIGDTDEISSCNVKLRELKARRSPKKRYRLLSEVYGFTRPVINKGVKESNN
ncbi:hypothetical protein ACS0TY_011533 [Phlomoides rotata]